LKAGQLDAGKARNVTLRLAGNSVSCQGQAYLVHFALPHFSCHITMAYAILRQNGVDLGERDSMGSVPGLSRLSSLASSVGEAILEQGAGCGPAACSHLACFGCPGPRQEQGA
jgi:hypothetical protein